jgi:hypothetical protein
MSMLAGLGRGLQGFSNLLGEHEKMNRAEQQRQVEWERQQHLEELRHRRSLEMQKDTQAFTAEQNEKQLTAQQQEAAIARANASRQSDKNFGQEKELLGLRADYEAAGQKNEASIRLQTAKDILKMETDEKGRLTEKAMAAFDKLAIPDNQRNVAKTLLEAGVGLETIVTMLGSDDTGKDTWTAEAINTAWKQESEAWDAMGEKEQGRVALAISEQNGDGQQVSLQDAKDTYIATQLDKRKSLGGTGKGKPSALQRLAGQGSEGQYNRETDLPQLLAMSEAARNETISKLPPGEREKVLKDLRGELEMETTRTTPSTPATTPPAAGKPLGKNPTQAEILAANEGKTPAYKVQSAEKMELEKSVEAEALRVAKEKGYKNKDQVDPALWKIFRNRAEINLGLKKGL